MTGEGHASPGRPYTLQEADDACLGRGPAAAKPPRLTVEDAVLFLLHEDPRPMEGKKSRVRRAFVAAARALRESGVEPVLFSGGRRGPRASHINDAVEQLAFSSKVRVSGGRGGRNLAIEITPRGRAAIKEEYESLPTAARAELARIRARLGAPRPRPRPPVVKGEARARGGTPPENGPRAAAEPGGLPALGEAAKIREYVDRADRLLEEGRQDEAYAAYKLAKGRGAPGADLDLRMARSLAEMGLHKDALRHCRDAIRADPAGAAGYLVMGHCLDRLGRHAKALSYSGLAVLRDPSNPQTYILRGVILSGLGRHAEALPNYQRAARLDPGDVQARQNASFSLFRLGRYEEALRQAEKAAEMSPGDPAAHERVVICLSSMGRREEAIPAGRKAIEAAPRRAGSYMPLATLLLELGRYGEALECCGRAAKADALDPRPRFFMALALYALGRREEALVHCRKSIELDPSNADFHATMSRLLLDLGRLPEALSHCEAVISADPGNLPALLSMGTMLADMGRHKEALACFGRALRIDPQQPVPRYNRALSLQVTGRPRRALKEYKRVIALDPGSAGAHNNAGTVLTALGRGGEALAHFDRALELDPCSAVVHLNKALSLQPLGLHREALAHFDRALELDPGSADAHVGRASCLDELGLPDEEIGRYAGAELGPAAGAAGAGSAAAGRHAPPVLPRPVAVQGPAPGGERAQLVKALLSRDESKTLEFKSWPASCLDRPTGSSRMEETIARELCSLANTEGGDLLVGVGDGGEAEGLAPGGGRLSRKERDKMLSWATGVIVSYLGAVHGGHFDCEIVEIDGLDILHCAVAASKDGPIILKKRLEGKHDFFMRAGSTCRPLGSMEMLEYVKTKWPGWASSPRPTGRSYANRGSEVADAAKSQSLDFPPSEPTRWPGMARAGRPASARS